MESLRYFAPLDPMNEYFPPNRFPKFAVALIAVGAISIVDTGLRSRSVTEDFEAVLRKIEYWPKARTFRCATPGRITSVRIGIDSAMSPRRTKSFLA